MCIAGYCIHFGFNYYASLSHEASKGAIQALRNASGGGGVSNFPEKSVTKVKVQCY